ncbi:MAG: hypothetical protein II797_05310, partial [Clostridia bacterium]|nr:hypothetical protein [Clostridia bacterium]
KDRPVETEFYLTDPPLVKIEKDFPYIPPDTEVEEVNGSAAPSQRAEQEEALKDVARKKFRLFLAKLWKGFLSVLKFIGRGIVFVWLKIKNFFVKIFYAIVNRGKK